ncbi:hypothetical protein [Paraburkholderia sp. Cpub6]|uniref:hypothetical protein n=1 Tax=Paraburkholderia sp. Cpub6 TaxID=2723094 RepID=UPI001615E193|nr:hypothetical protein [Paraburkholderia sp. Cpub6]MBB5460190.1 hypothetical protein [Paraburkholderia sp. Cpub6]
MNMSHHKPYRYSNHRYGFLSITIDAGIGQVTAFNPNRITESHMRNKTIASILFAASFSFAAPVFASGYGPAPFYRPADGAPASQRGQSAETLASSLAVVDARETYGSNATTETRASSKSDSLVQNSAASEGGIADGTSASGSHHPLRALGHSIQSVGHAVRSSVRTDPNDGMKSVYFGH